MSNLINLLPDSGRGMTVSEFEAVREQRRQSFAVSGFIEPGKHYEDTVNKVVNQGIWCTVSGGISNTFRMGRVPGESVAMGESDTAYPVYNVDGLRIVQDKVAATGRNNIVLPPAPSAKVETSTTTTRDYACGDHVVIGNDTYICIEDAPAGMLITDITYFKPVDVISREDLVGMEVFLVEIGDGPEQVPAVFPLGNVQYAGRTSPAYADGVMPQSYSAFGTWDTETWGRGYTWDLMSEEDKINFLNDPDNNMYRDGKRIFQWQYRFRSFAGVGDDWRYNSGFDDNANADLGNRGDLVKLAISAQGYNETPYPYNSGRTFFQINSDNRPADVDAGVAITNPEFVPIKAIGSIYWMGIARVTRLNQGVYHPVFNSTGTLHHGFANGSGGSKWWVSGLAKPAQSVSDCFLDQSNGGSAIHGMYGGSIDQPHSGHPMNYYHDIIYDWQIQDLRVSAHGIDVDSDAFAGDLLNGRIRGWEQMKGLAVMRSTITTLDVGTGEIRIPPSGALARFAQERRLGGGCWIYNVDKDNFIPASKIKWTDTVGDDLYYPIGENVSPTILEGSTITGSSNIATYPGDTKLFTTWDVNDSVIVLMPITLPYSLEHRFVTEVCAKPTVLADLLDNFGVDFVPNLNWLPALPNDTNKSFKLLRRLVDKYPPVTTDDGGVSWDIDYRYTNNFDVDENAAMVTMASGSITLLSYVYRSKMLLNSSTGRALATAELGKVYAVRGGDSNVILPALLGKVGGPVGGMAYTSHSLERALLNYGDKEGGVFESSWSGEAVKHSSIAAFFRGDGVKILPYLSRDLAPQAVYGNVMFRELQHFKDLHDVKIVDLATSVTHGLVRGDRFVIKNSSNPVMNDTIFVMVLDPDSNWDHDSFQNYYINYEDNHVYKANGYLHPMFMVEPINNVGDDDTMQNYHQVTFSTNLNNQQIARGQSRTVRPLGFLPKEKR